MILSLILCSAVTLPAAGDSVVTDSESRSEAETILRSMTRYLGGLKSFTAEAELDNQVLSTSGEKIHLTSSGQITIQRPNHFHLSRHGGIANVELFFDGKQITLFGKNIDAYYSFAHTGDIDSAIDYSRNETGLDISGGDLLYLDAYDGLMTGVVSAEYRGTGVVDGEECHHLAFRADTHDWQIWIQTGDRPLPMMYVIISKWITAAPEYVLRLDDWEINPKFESDPFVFTPGPKTRKLDSLSVDETGEAALGEAK
jgi:hypothetical protein